MARSEYEWVVPTPEPLFRVRRLLFATGAALAIQVPVVWLTITLARFTFGSAFLEGSSFGLLGIIAVQVVAAVLCLLVGGVLILAGQRELGSGLLLGWGLCTLTVTVVCVVIAMNWWQGCC